MCSKRMGKIKSFKTEKGDFTKDICNLMNKQARNEKHKSEKLAKAQRSRVVEGSYSKVSKEGKTSEIDLTSLKKKEWDDD